MKRILVIAVVAATLTCLSSTASAYDQFHGSYGGHHTGHNNYVHGGHGNVLQNGYRGGSYGYGATQPYAPAYGYSSNYRAQPFGYQPSYGGGYAPNRGYGIGRGLHLDIGGVHILGNHHH